MTNPGKLNVIQMTQAVSAEEAMNIIQKGTLEQLEDIECEMIRAKADDKFLDIALDKISKLKKELISDLDNQD